MNLLPGAAIESEVEVVFEYVGFWDYVTFASFFVVGMAFLALIAILAGLPGRIAIARKHPDAEAILIMGWAGFLPVVPWIQAFIWAFKPTDVVDIRYFPRDKQREIDEQIAKLSGKPRVGTVERPQGPEPLKRTE